ncbi:IS30 family transposase [Marinococcus sp. PL1-022]|uniref:IS30 family transposase n=1 Tax=Marinococcus sp. PL1-022 TaxID=3095363 RepID=UPI0029C59DB2|nr:IS30 family transposase [Marinococcus sp. PL1-022]MDX6152536.1 IS30 family transposase [Marinococcus sp. PL1-022]
MTYTHLSTNEVVLIEAYNQNEFPVFRIARQLGRARQTIHNVVSYLREGHRALDYVQRYQANKQRCGRRPTVLTPADQVYVTEKIKEGWTPDVIAGRRERPLPCSGRPLYRMFERWMLDRSTLPMKGKRKPNGHQERRGKQAFRRTLADRDREYPAFRQEFGHLEGDTIVGRHHQSAVITLVERLSKVIVTLQPAGRKARDIETTLHRWCSRFPKHLFKSITFDCGKEFSNWQSISNRHDLAIYFADPGTPSQRGLNEHSNGLLRKDGLPKHMDFQDVDQSYVSAVASGRNHIPRKSLDYCTPLEVFMRYMENDMVSNLI